MQQVVAASCSGKTQLEHLVWYIQGTVKVHDWFWRLLLTFPPSLHQRLFSAQPTEVLFDHSCPGRFGTFAFYKCISMLGITTYSMNISIKSPLLCDSCMNCCIHQLTESASTAVNVAWPFLNLFQSLDKQPATRSNFKLPQGPGDASLPWLQ